MNKGYAVRIELNEQKLKEMWVTKDKYHFFRSYTDYKRLKAALEQQIKEMTTTGGLMAQAASIKALHTAKLPKIYARMGDTPKTRPEGYNSWFTYTPIFVEYEYSCKLKVI